MRALIGYGSRNPKMYSQLQKIVENAQNKIPLSEVALKAPIKNPEKIICVGLNYRDHAIESNMPIPSEPVFFSKWPNTLTGTNQIVIKPNETEQLDYEVELVVVIGKRGKNIPESEALQYVAGYTVGNDISARDWQLKKSAGQWILGKSWDTFAPIGPAITVNPLLLDPNTTFDPNNLGLRCILNGQTVQNGTTKEFIFNVQAVIAYISKIATLNPGDLIFTGTPPGVGMGRKPQLWLQPKDTVVCEIDELGSITNKIVVPKTQGEEKDE
eukprot:TRINITY_DN6632_c0_g1_i1.p1 TRINITY_DN6632_c0_g1~~TRINITY_DN6632_c0_g1_i1.p1  ORF type:complete len:311 (-),score=81.66 TRINITY_DN6632_c0_g1_i1:53-862(-)